MTMLAIQVGQGAFIGMFVLIAALIIAGIIWGAAQKKKRRLALEAWAGLRGLSFDPEDDDTLARNFPAFKPLHTGSRRYAYNVMTGEVERGYVCAFDYHYETYSTDSKGNRTTHHHHFSCVVVESGLFLKPLTIRAENFFDKMKGAFGFDDIDFESAEFSRKFWVTSKHKRWAYDVIHQETMELLLKSPRFAIELDGPHALARRGKRFKPIEFDQALALLWGVLDRIPSDLQKDLRG